MFIIFVNVCSLLFDKYVAQKKEIQEIGFTPGVKRT
jgi:hypothetical protein